MYYRMRVLGCNLHSGMRSRCGGATYQYRDVFTRLFKFFYQVHHFVKRRSNQPRQTNGVYLLGKCLFNNALWRYHNPHINDVIIVTSQDHTNNIFTNIVYVAFYGCHQNFSCSFRLSFLGGFNVRQ